MTEEVLFTVGALPGDAGRARVVSIHALAGEEALPLASASAQAVYIARALEYLDTPAALRALLEARRVLSPDGRLVVVLPDFDRALDGWRRRDPSLLSGEWSDDAAGSGARASQTAPVSLDHWAAAIFCSFESADASGDPCDVGPPRWEAAALRGLSAAPSPFRLSCELRKMAIDRGGRVRFRRRNAWSRRELAELLGQAGFRVRSFDDEAFVGVVAVAAEASGAVGARLEKRPFLCCLAEPVGARPGGLTEADKASAEAWFRRGGELAAAGDLRSGVMCYRQAVALNPALGPAHYQLLWDTYAKLARLAAGRPGDRGASSFSRLGYRQGRVTEGALAVALDALAAAPAVPLAVEDFEPGYAHYAGLSVEGLRNINADHTFFALGPAQQSALAPMLGELRRPLEECLGAPFRLINVRCWKTRPCALATETNGWHYDETYPPSVVKVMVYLTGAGAEAGSTELALSDGSRVAASGPPGAYLIFKNLELMHRGVASTARERAVLELTVAPSLHTDLRPTCAGLNAEFPWLPWHLDDGGVGEREPRRSPAQFDEKGRGLGRQGPGREAIRGRA